MTLILQKIKSWFYADEDLVYPNVSVKKLEAKNKALKLRLEKLNEVEEELTQLFKNNN